MTVPFLPDLVPQPQSTLDPTLEPQLPPSFLDSVAGLVSNNPGPFASARLRSLLKYNPTPADASAAPGAPQLPVSVVRPAPAEGVYGDTYNPMLYGSPRSIPNALYQLSHGTGGATASMMANPILGRTIGPIIRGQANANQLVRAAGEQAALGNQAAAQSLLLRAGLSAGVAGLNTGLLTLPELGGLGALGGRAAEAGMASLPSNFAILTAENPNNTALSLVENRARNTALENELMARGYEFGGKGPRRIEPVKGVFSPDNGKTLLHENSYIVHGMTPDEAAEVGLKHGQASVITRRGLHDLKAKTTAPLKGVNYAPQDVPYTERGNGERIGMDFDFDNQIPGIENPDTPEGYRNFLAGLAKIPAVSTTPDVFGRLGIPTSGAREMEPIHVPGHPVPPARPGETQDERLVDAISSLPSTYFPPPPLADIGGVGGDGVPPHSLEPGFPHPLDFSRFARELPPVEPLRARTPGIRTGNNTAINMLGTMTGAGTGALAGGLAGNNPKEHEEGAVLGGLAGALGSFGLLGHFFPAELDEAAGSAAAQRAVKSGRPGLIGYHGTFNDFDVPTPQNGDIGVHWGSSPEQAYERLFVRGDSFGSQGKTPRLLTADLDVKPNQLANVTDMGSFDGPQRLANNIAAANNMPNGNELTDMMDRMWARGLPYEVRMNALREYLENTLGFRGLQYANEGEVPGATRAYRLLHNLSSPSPMNNPEGQRWLFPVDMHEALLHHARNLPHDPSYITWNPDVISSLKSEPVDNNLLNETMARRDRRIQMGLTEAPQSLRGREPQLGLRLRNRAGAVGKQPGGKTLHSGLSQADAAAKMKELSAAGTRAQMRRTADGTFEIVTKGEPQPGTKVAKVAKAPVVAPAPGLAGKPASEAGFQSRLVTALHGNPALIGHAPQSIAKWKEQLLKTPGINRAEVNATMERILEGWADGARPVSADEMLQLAVEHSPVSSLTRTVRQTEPEGNYDDFDPAEHVDYDAVRNDAEEYVRESETDWRDVNLHDAVGELSDAYPHLVDTYGVKGADAVMARLHEYFPETVDDRGYDENEGYDDLSLDTMHPTEDELDRLLGRNPNSSEQFSMFPQRNVQSYGRARRAIDRARDSLFIARNVHNTLVPGGDLNPDLVSDEYNRLVEQAEADARDNYEPTGGAGDTEYSEYQRVDPDADYREILLHQPGLGVRAPHFNQGQDLVAHARGELSGGNYRMIEAQSDAAKKLRHSNSGSEQTAMQTAFKPTENWAQLATGASLHQAADEGASTFSFVTPENRMHRASLEEESANATYGHAVPKALKRIFEHLGIPYEEVSRDADEVRVKLTPEAREKILKYGVPALGAVGAASRLPRPTSGPGLNLQQVLRQLGLDKRTRAGAIN